MEKVVLTVAPIASGQAGYYLSLASSASSYYVDEKGIEPAGVWYGPGAAEFGLSGVVEADPLTRLCEGVDPDNPEKKLVRNALTENRAHGTDLCFSAPKSVSVAWSLSNPDLREAIEKAMHRAVRDGLDYIQDKCGLARVGAQGQRLERVPLMFALFEHSSSRAGDAQLHVHAVCPNVTRHADGRTTAIDPTSFYHHMMAGGAIFRASLAEGLSQLGFAVEREKSCFRIKGVSQELCERTSQRRAEILEGIFERCKSLGKLEGLSEKEVLKATSGRMAEIVNLETRKAKKERSREDVFRETREVARELGIGEHSIEGLLKAPRKLTPDQKAEVKEQVYRSSIDKLSNQQSHWNERDLTRMLAEESQGRGLNARDVRELVEHKLAGLDLVRVGELVTDAKNGKRQVWRERTEERFSTKEIIQQETLMLSAIEGMAKKSAAVEMGTVKLVVEHARSKLASEGKTLSKEQETAIESLTAKDGLIACLQGKAGTTKSTVLGSCRLAWELDGKRVIGCAIAGVASDALKESSGIESDTLAMTLAHLKYGKLTLTPNHVVVLDEAGMVPTKRMAELIHHVEKAGAKLVLAGDQGQIQAIEAGGPFGSICTRQKEQTCELTQIHRQREEWRRTTVEQLSRGEVKEALIAYAAHDQLHVTATRDEAYAKLVDLWKADQGHTREHAAKVFILAPMNCEVEAINRLCQKERLEEKELGEKNLKVGGDRVYEGERILLTKKDRDLKVENGFFGEVTAIDEAKQTLTVRLDKLDRVVTVSVPKFGADRIKLGYCSTVHKSQGSTRETVHVLLGGHMMDKHLSYVAGSRSQGATHLVCDQPTVGKDPTIKDAIRTLARAMSRDRTKDLARDLIDRAQPPVQRQPLPEEQRRQPMHALSLGM